MINQTKIEWTDFTVNFWEGCQKVGPGCDHCYAEARDVRFTGGSHWGPGAPRRKVKGGIAKLRKINRDAPKFHAANGHWPRVFCSSLSDVFDNAVDRLWREEALLTVQIMVDTRIQLLTKRVGNVEKMVEGLWLAGWPQHVGLMITVVNQAEANRDIPNLLYLKAQLGIPWVGLSVEPMLGPIDLTHIVRRGGAGILRPLDRRFTTLDWIICGGESGPGARPMHPDWARSLRDQCATAGTPFLFKQWGEWVQAHYTVCPDSDMSTNKAVWLGWDGTQAKPSHHGLENPIGVIRVGKKRAGRLLDGVEHNGFPGVLA